MSSIGPSLPPHLLAKRKRQQEEASEAAAAKPEPDARRSSPDGPEKRMRIAGPVMGPAAPPAPLDERPDLSANDDQSGSDSDSSDDDFGPAVPTGDAATKAYSSDEEDTLGPQMPSGSVNESSGPKRDDWMMLPPTADGLSKNLDPTKRAKQFRSGPKASLGSGGGEGMDSSWTETPEEKRKRLQDQVLGISSAPASSKASGERVRSRQDEESARRIKEHSDKHRGQSLFEQHRSSKTAEKEDDPSKRAFDREKDIGANMFGRDREKEMKKQAANFGDKFSGGKFL